MTGIAWREYHDGYHLPPAGRHQGWHWLPCCLQQCSRYGWFQGPDRLLKGTVIMMMMMMILTVMVLMIIIFINTCLRCGWSQCPDRSGWWWKGLWWGWRWRSVMLAMVVLMIMIIKYTLSKTKFSPSHLQVVQVFDGFDVSNEQVRMNFNGSSRLWNLFEIHIPYYPWRRSWIAFVPVLCSIPSSVR